MHWTALLAKRFFPPEARVVEDVTCINCGYNLRGLRAVGYCPECNSQVGDSLFVLARPEVVARGLQALGKGHLAALGLGLGCVINAYWPLFVSVGILFLGAIWRSMGLYELRFRAAIENLPVIAARLRAMAVVSLINTFTTLLWLIAILLIAMVPSLQGLPAAARVANALAIGWVFTWLLDLGVTGWFGSALATMLGYGWMIIELRVQLIVVMIGGAATVPLIAVSRLSLSPTAQFSVLAMFCLLGFVMVLLTTASLLHIANGAEKEFDTMDEAINSGRVAIMPGTRGEYRDESEPIQIAAPDDPASRG
jgi:hypothetical protein